VVKLNEGAAEKTETKWLDEFGHAKGHVLTGRIETKDTGNPDR
jgi:hypothetical protein